MKKIVKSMAAVVIAGSALISLPSSAFAGSKARTTCSESFAEWHQSLAQPPGGYVTVDIGVNGVDYTTTAWNSPGFIGLGARFEGTTYRIYWHAADGTVLTTKGKGVAVVIEDCPTTTTTIAATTTTAAATTTTAAEATTTAGPTTSTTATATTTVESGSNGPTTTVASDSKGPVPSTTRPGGPTPTDILPETGPGSASSSTIVAVIALCLGFTLLGLTRRRPRLAQHRS
jgi:LPXTG-motif cell wall-anchored protein